MKLFSKIRAETLFLRQLTKRRNVTTWSALASAFNTRQSKKLNFNLLRNETGLFGISELADPTGFYLLRERATLKTDDLINESSSPSRTRKMVDVFDDLSDTLCQVADLAEFIRVAHPQTNFRSAAEDAATSITSLVEKLNVNRQLYINLKSVVEQGDVVKTDSVDDHVARLFLVDFEQSGIHLEDKKREKAVHLNEYILHLGANFMHNCHQPRSVPKRSLPTQISNVFNSQGENVIINSLYADSNIESIREAAYKIYLHPDSHQEELLSRLLTSRQQLAELCGFSSFSQRALRGSLAEKPDLVTNFLEQLSQGIREPAKANFDLMETTKRKNNSNLGELKPWDIPYMSALIKNERFKFNVSEVTPYFSLGGCMEGLNLLFNSLFEVTLKLEEPAPGETWNPDVYKLAVVHEAEGLLGYIYCDFFERQGKPNQDCHFTIKGGRNLEDASYQLPIVVLMLNFPQSSWNSPSLLTPSMVENLFHEMGHAMHSMLGRTKHQHVTGTRCSTDFAEVPSVLMEYFATDPRVLSKFARHYKTGEPIPYNVLQMLCSSKKLLAASDTQQQLFYSILDQRYHSGFNGEKSTTDILAEVQNEYYCLPHVANTVE